MDSNTNSWKTMMSGDKVARLGWIVALIMFSIALLLFIRIMTEESSFREIRANILEVCASPGTSQDAECASELGKLYAILEDVQAEREKAATEAAEEAAAAPAEEAPAAPVAPAATTSPVL